jgi:hypothetical protein
MSCLRRRLLSAEQQSKCERSQNNVRGIDVGKKFITVCVLIGTADADPTAEKPMFGTINAELEALREWLQEQGCTHIAMESTGPYWRPVFNILEDAFIVVLANGAPWDPSLKWRL